MPEQATSLPAMMKVGRNEVDCALVFAKDGIFLVFLKLPLLAQKVLGRRPSSGKDFYSWERRYSSYEKKSAEEILAENERNTFVPYSQVIRCDLSQKLFRPCRIDINTRTDVYRLKFYGVSDVVLESKLRKALPLRSRSTSRRRSLTSLDPMYRAFG